MSDGRNGNWKVGKPFRTMKRILLSVRRFGRRPEDHPVPKKRRGRPRLDALHAHGLQQHRARGFGEHDAADEIPALGRHSHGKKRGVRPKGFRPVGTRHDHRHTGCLGRIPKSQLHPGSSLQRRRGRGSRHEHDDPAHGELDPEGFRVGEFRIAPGVAATTAFLLPNGYVWGALDANGQFSDADSTRAGSS